MSPITAGILGAAVGYVFSAIVFLFGAWVDHQSTVRILKALKGDED